MMILRSTVLVILLCAMIDVCLAGEVPVLKPGDFPSASIIKTEFYSGKALFGYIDGGAELYLEYKFEKLGRQEIRYSRETVIAEIYQMSGAYEAYGIFSIQRFKCVPVDSASPNTCLSRYQLQAVVGNCYLSIVNQTGSAAAQQASVEIYKAIKAKIIPQRMPLPSLFRLPVLSPYLNQLTIICGTLGIQNGFSEWETLFQGIPRFSLTMVPIQLGPEHLTVAHVRFLTEREQLEFCRLSGFENAEIGVMKRREAGGLFRALKRANEDEILLLEASISFPNRDSFLNLLAK